MCPQKERLSRDMLFCSFRSRRCRGWSELGGGSRCVVESRLVKSKKHNEKPLDLGEMPPWRQRTLNNGGQFVHTGHGAGVPKRAPVPWPAFLRFQASSMPRLVRARRGLSIRGRIIEISEMNKITKNSFGNNENHKIFVILLIADGS